MVRSIRVLCGFAATLAAAAAPAQPVPGQVQPGQIERQFDRTRPPAPGGEVLVPAVPEPRAPAGSEATRFLLQRLVLDGVTVYGEGDLRPAWQDLLGREVSLAQLYEVAQALTRRYRNDGYILSQVVVPAQTIRDGTARLQAVEGYVANVRLQGDAGAARERIEAYLRPVGQARPLHSSVLERALLLVNDLAGVSARSVLSASAQPGASDLTVSVARVPHRISLGINNRGSRFLGPWRVQADADLHGLLGGGDRSSLRLVRTLVNDELTFASAAHERPLGSGGMRLGLNAGLVEAQPEVGAALPGLETSARSAGASLSYPLVRSRLSNLSARASLAWHDGRSDAAGIRLMEDRVRALRLGLTWDAIDALRGINLAEVELSQGLDAFGATDRSPTGSRASAPADFQKATLYAARLQSLAPRWSLLAALSAQHAFANLAASEQFGYGGEHFGRAYDAAELLSDHGLAFKAELRFNGRGGDMLRDYMVYAFYDTGRVWRRDPQPGEVRTQSAEALGAGFRFNARHGVSGYVELAVPNRIVAAEGKRASRLFTGLQVNF